MLGTDSGDSAIRSDHETAGGHLAPGPSPPVCDGECTGHRCVGSVPGM
jgi:hypothetical protein